MRETTDFERFFKDNFQHFYFYAFRLVGDEEVSRDMVYEAVESLLQQDIAEGKWFSYTVSNIRNRCLDHLRHQAVHQKYADFYTHILDHHEDLTMEEEDERLTAIKRILDTLSPRTQLVFRECHINQKTYREVADELGVSTNMVKKYIVTALRTIREQLTAQGYAIRAKKS